MYASHCQSEIEGFSLRDYANCPYYTGNKGNWQRIYDKRLRERINQELVDYLESDAKSIAAVLTDLTDILFTTANGAALSKLYNRLVDSFKENGGFCLDQLVPDAIPYQLLVMAGALPFWGFRFTEKLKDSFARRYPRYADYVDADNQFKPRGADFFFSASLDNDENPHTLSFELFTKQSGDSTFRLGAVNANWWTTCC